ncbi:Putative zinc metalloprotease Rip3 [Aquisphaera giovannonii]|uniref:Zinc metalloprotease Rip3 n=1 Tax=Aquisphaera giovannonii TaxID=406548 RepID=A0A5B9W0X4_9BACT|nr:site-2 protease family protein [Aquisphaera giovannonii]QEH33919.1 Putative zinc metalloprotease Rip3 [Aquisphaera giovannonii]
MSDPLTWSPIRLGRWFGTTVRVHIFLILFVGSELLMALLATRAEDGVRRLPATACWLGLLLAALAIHELAHALAAYLLDTEQEEVHLWPLGNLVTPSAPARGGEHMLVALAGPAVSGALFLGIALGLEFLARAHFVWNPFGNGPVAGVTDSGAPTLAGGSLARPLSRIWTIGWFGYVNYLLFLANLLPALPFDGGRMLRGYLSSHGLVSSRDSIYAPWTARATAAILFLTGLARLLIKWRADGLTLIMLALLIEWLVRSESRILEDGGYFEDGVFGYDFSEGYTSLESSAAKVRPYRESAIRRWRRRRSELRRQRRMAREAAEERRMDEILDKLHRQGRSALTDEENRFLVRVSTRYRNRSKTQD